MKPAAPDPTAMLDSFARLAATITAKRDALIAILQEVESHETIEDEIFKSTDGLLNAGVEAQYYGQRVESAASFLPLNLPLYSVILFGVLPSAVTKRMYVRAPSRLRSVVARLCEVLDLETSFPLIRVSGADRETFIRDHAASADVVIFTGKLSNAQKLRPQLRRDVLFLFSGRGVNPIVIGADADIESAIEKTAHVKLFNSGQDCAAPDCILVHKMRSRELVEGLKRRLAEVSTGAYTNPTVKVGALVEAEQLTIAAKHLAEHQENIVFGGTIDFRETIVHPTVIFYPRFQRTNATELFSPVFFVTEYESEQQLRQYFDGSQYRENAMYASLFGSSAYLESQRHTIVLRDTIVNEVERGNLEYGGRSLGASFVHHDRNFRAKPILISREVSEHLAWLERGRAEAGVEPAPVTTARHAGYAIHRARGPLAGPRLLVVTGTGDERGGTYACQRLLHELRARRTRIDVGEVTFFVVERGHSVPNGLLAALAADADETLVLRSFEMNGTPFIVGAEHDSERASLAAALGVGRIVVDRAAAASSSSEIVVQCGDDRDPSASDVAYDVVLNACRYLDMIGGGNVQPPQALGREFGRIPFLATKCEVICLHAPRRTGSAQHLLEGAS